jgi:hypothetical protein
MPEERDPGKGMTIEQALFARLDAQVAAVGNRISPEWRREGTTLPALVYSVDSREPVRSFSGSEDLHSFAITVTTIADTMSSARSVADAVRAALDTNTAYTSSGTTVACGYLTSEDVERIEDGSGDDDGPRAIQQGYTVWATGG